MVSGAAFAACSGGGDANGGDGNGGGGGGGTWNPPTETGTVKFPYTAYQCKYALRQVSPSKPTATFDDGSLGAAAQPKNLHLTFAGDPSVSVVIQWSTDDATKATQVHTKPAVPFVSSGREKKDRSFCGLFRQTAAEVTDARRSRFSRCRRLVVRCPPCARVWVRGELPER